MLHSDREERITQVLISVISRVMFVVFAVLPAYLIREPKSARHWVELHAEKWAITKHLHNIWASLATTDMHFALR